MSLQYIINEAKPFLWSDAKFFETKMQVFVAVFCTARAVFCTARGERGYTVGGCFRDVRSLPSGTHHRLVPRRNAQPEDVQIEEKKNWNKNWRI